MIKNKRTIILQAERAFAHAFFCWSFDTMGGFGGQAVWVKNDVASNMARVGRNGRSVLGELQNRWDERWKMVACMS